MAWIDYKKAYDMVPHSWIREFFRFVWSRANIIKTLLVNSIEKWRVMMCAGNLELEEVDIKRGIFQEDSLSPLVFVLVLVPLSLILTLLRLGERKGGGGSSRPAVSNNLIELFIDLRSKIS